jgi:hypothetical protein
MQVQSFSVANRERKDEASKLSLEMEKLSEIYYASYPGEANSEYDSDVTELLHDIREGEDAIEAFELAIAKFSYRMETIDKATRYCETLSIGLPHEKTCRQYNHAEFKNELDSQSEEQQQRYGKIWDFLNKDSAKLMLFRKFVEGQPYLKGLQYLTAALCLTPLSEEYCFTLVQKLVDDMGKENKKLCLQIESLLEGYLEHLSGNAPGETGHNNHLHFLIDDISSRRIKINRKILLVIHQLKYRLQAMDIATKFVQDLELCLPMEAKCHEFSYESFRLTICIGREERLLGFGHIQVASWRSCLRNSNDERTGDPFYQGWDFIAAAICCSRLGRNALNDRIKELGHETPKRTPKRTKNKKIEIMEGVSENYDGGWPSDDE